MLDGGQTYQNLEIIEPLGYLRTFQNYLARPLGGGARVRLTILTDELLGSEQEREAFVQALEPLCQLRNKGLARLVEVGIESGQVFYISEFFPQGNLKRLLGKRLPPGRALRMLRDLLRTLVRLHAQNVVHGNVKPGNILLNDAGRPILTDAGVAAQLSLDYTLGIDPYYVSPEQVRGGSPVAASDIYSLGVALFQMLEGKPPFQADNDFRIGLLRLDEPVPQLKDYRFIQPLLDQMLQIDPAQRPSASELLRELEPLILEADACATEESKESGAELEEEGPKEAVEKPEPADMVKRIEQTLQDREEERLRAKSVEVELPLEKNTNPSNKSHYLMLLLGFLIGAVIGAAFFLSLSGKEIGSGQPTAHLALEPSGPSEGDRLVAAGKLEQGKRAYLKEIETASDQPRAYNNLASIYAAEGDLEQAQALLKKALETNPDYLAIYRNIGTVYAAMARDSYGKALQLEGEAIPVRLQLLGTATQAVLAEETQIPVKAVPEKAPVVAEASPAVVAKTEPRSEPLISNEVATAASEEHAPAVVEEGSPQETSVSVEKPAELLTEEQPPVVVDTDTSISPRDFLLQWAKAWTAQDIEGYLSSYADDYRPAGYDSHQAWVDKRSQRLKVPTYIEVTLDPIESLSGSGEVAELRLVQNYRSDRYSDRTRKLFVLRKQGGSWKITEERSLGRVN